MNLDWMRWARWVNRVAFNMTTSRPWLRDDLAQEGMVAVWQASVSYDPERGASLDSWLKFKAIGRMKDWLRNLATGTQLVGVEDERELEAPTPPTDSDLAYHHEEIAEAVAGLTPAQRKYVELRFWRGLTHEDMVEHFGYTPNALWSSRKNGARRKLQSSLGHLAEVA